MRFVILALLVVCVLYVAVDIFFRAWWKAGRVTVDEAKIQAELEHAASRVIPPDFTLTKSKYTPNRGIDVGSSLSRIYIMDKPRDVVIDDLLQSFKAQGYSPEETDIPGEMTSYSTYHQFPFFSIEIPYEDPPIHINVYVT